MYYRQESDESAEDSYAILREVSCVLLLLFLIFFGTSWWWYYDSDSHSYFWLLEVLAWLMLIIGLISLVSYAYRKRMVYEQLPYTTYTQYGQPVDGVYYSDTNSNSNSNTNTNTSNIGNNNVFYGNRGVPMPSGGYQNFQPTAYYHPYYSSYAHPAYFPAQVATPNMAYSQQFTARPPNVSNLYSPAPYVGVNTTNVTSSTTPLVSSNSSSNASTSNTSQRS